VKNGRANEISEKLKEIAENEQLKKPAIFI